MFADKMKEKKKTRFRDQLLIVVLLPILIPLAVCFLILMTIASMVVHLSVWVLWSSRGIRLLFVHSNSPVWQDHIQKEILPRIPQQSIILNWSERKKWRPSLAAMVFHHFGGHRNFNPLGIVVKPFRRAKVFRFHEAFEDFKHGKPDALNKIESEFFTALKPSGVTSPYSSNEVLRVMGRNGKGGGWQDR